MIDPAQEATVRLCRWGQRWWIVFTFSDGESIQSEQNFASKEDAQAALQTWCRATGSTTQTAQ